MKSIRTFLSFFTSLFVRVIAAILAGTVLLTLVYCIPADTMEHNLAKSVPVLAAEGSMPELFSWCTSFLDNQTDAVMLSHAAHTTAENPLVQAMSAVRHHMRGHSDVDSLAAHYLYGQSFDEDIPYYQYWHGYLVFLKPLLLMTTYQGIRIVNAAVQTILLFLLVWLMFRKGLKHCILPYLICVAFLMPVTLAMSLQFSTCYYIMTIGSIAVLLTKEHPDSKDAQIFLYIGIAAAFFDFLTYPIATLGIPAVFYFCLRKEGSIRDTFCRGVRICFSWAFGYGTMWAGKWLVGSLTTGINVLSTATSKISERTSSSILQEESIAVSPLTALSVNIRFFLNTPASVILAVYILVILALLALMWKKKGLTVASAVQTLFPFVILACLPPVWYLVTVNHSVIHYWFTCKALVVSAFAGMCALSALRTE